MIFVTVGSQLAFDRMVRGVDAWAERCGRSDVFAQIGDTSLRPRAIEWAESLDVERFREKLGAADAVVAHAGTGTIITALELGRPLIVMPRRAALGETRNDHQLATARRFAAAGLVTVALDDAELARALDAADSLSKPPAIAPQASPQLIDTVRNFLAARGDSKNRTGAPTR